MFASDNLSCEKLKQQNVCNSSYSHAQFGSAWNSKAKNSMWITNEANCLNKWYYVIYNLKCENNND